jgi:hypothetical protein
MDQLLKVFTGSFWRYLYAWMLPSAIAVGAFALVILPEVRDLPVLRDLAATTKSAVAGGLILGFASLTLSALLALNYVPLYRLLEGYNWPEWLFRRRRRAQINAWKDLKQEMDRLSKLAYPDRSGASDDEDDASDGEVGAADDEIDDRRAYSLNRYALASEQLKQFPESAEHFLPTRLGTALRAMETYGQQRYGLDSQTFWYELGTLVPEPLQKENENARATVDFFISFLFVSSLFSLSALVIAVLRGRPSLLVAAAAAGILMPYFYQRAVKSVGELQYAVQAIVNVGRTRLAQAYGLRLPATVQEERELWSALTDFVAWGEQGNEQAAKLLERWRSSDPGPEQQPEVASPAEAAGSDSQGSGDGRQNDGDDEET